MKKESFEVNELSELRNRTGERVVRQTQDSELVKIGQCVWRESAAEFERVEDQANDSASSAFDAAPLAVIDGVTESVVEFVVCVGCGFESEKSVGVVGQW